MPGVTQHHLDVSRPPLPHSNCLCGDSRDDGNFSSMYVCDAMHTERSLEFSHMELLRSQKTSRAVFGTVTRPPVSQTSHSSFSLVLSNFFSWNLQNFRYRRSGSVPGDLQNPEYWAIHGHIAEAAVSPSDIVSPSAALSLRRLPNKRDIRRTGTPLCYPHDKPRVRHEVWLGFLLLEALEFNF